MSSDLRLIQLSNYVKPDLVENKSKNWVLNGAYNSFYEYIIDRFNGSPTNSAIITAYTQYIYGRGLNAKNKSMNQWLKLVTILSSSDLKKVVSDFELFGEASMQVIKTKGGDLSSIKHIPKQLVVPALENEDGEIEGYWYCKNWKKWQSNTPEYFPAFGTSKEAIEIYVIKPYRAGKNYFADPSYLSILPYCEVEEELANFYINSIKKGLSAGYMIQIPDGNSYTDEEKNEFEAKIKAKLTGSPNAMDFVISFNGRDAEVTVTPFPVNEQMHKQWEYLTSEARQQIMVGHQVTSPMLFGIKDNTGFGNNAEELDTAEVQLMRRVITPKQDYIINALDEILQYYGISLDLYFMPLVDPTPLAQNVSTTLSSVKSDLDLFIEMGQNEEIEGYELVEVKQVDYEEEERINFASTGTATPYNKSRYDLFDTITRYRYAGSDIGEREFCNKMVSSKKIYRIEDIELMNENVVNPGFGPNGSDIYNIFKYKGGPNCYHYWEKLTYKRKNENVKVDVKSPIAIDKSVMQPAKGLAGIEPINMPNNGYLPK